MYLALVLIAGFLAESLVWQERAPLPLPRAGYMAGVIDGHFVLAGGSYWTEKRKLWTDRVDIFDPQANVWRPAASLPEPRSDAACVTLKNSLYLFGGGAEGTTRRDALVFRNGEWKPRPAAQLPSPRIYAVAVASGSSIYLFGGLSKANDYHTANDTLWVWNPASPESGWKQLQSLPGPQRFDHGVAELRGKIYVFGGATGEGAGVRNLHDAYQFDIRSGKWTKLPDLPLARRAWWAWARGFSFWEVTPKVMRLKSTSLTPHRRDSA